MTDTNTKTYVVAQENLKKLVEKLDKLGRRAEKLGIALSTTCSAPSSTSRTWSITRAVQSGAWRGPALADVQAKKPESVGYFRFQEITVTGATPRLAGWTFVGTLQHLTDDQGRVINLLRTVPSFQGQLPEKFRTASPENCDHCRKAIKTRKDTFVVKHENGEWKQVGRNCTQDFLGGADPHMVASCLDLVLRAFEEAESSSGDGFGGSGGAYRFDMATFLAVVATLVRREGWVSRGRARFDGMLQVTADMALDYLIPPRDSQDYARWSEWVAKNPVEAEDRELAEKALDYARYELANKARSDYEHNLYTATLQATVDERLADIITASLVPYYLKEVERKAVREAELRRVANSRFVGTEGERLVLTVQVVRRIACESQFRASYLHKLISTEGTRWSGSARTRQQPRPGETYTVKATVKKHEVYKGVRQTVLSRLTVMTAEDLAKEAKKTARKAKAEQKPLGPN